MTLLMAIDSVREWKATERLETGASGGKPTTLAGIVSFCVEAARHIAPTARAGALIPCPGPGGEELGNEVQSLHGAPMATCAVAKGRT